VQVFVVWEPMLVSDVAPPTRFAMHRISDHRVRQYWDEQHTLARQMKADARAPQPEPHCCDMDGILWDLAAVYPKSAVWKETLPRAVVFDGPVVSITSSIEAAFTGDAMR
jgi:hypothetical protein